MKFTFNSLDTMRKLQDATAEIQRKLGGFAAQAAAPAQEAPVMKDINPAPAWARPASADPAAEAARESMLKTKPQPDLKTKSEVKPKTAPAPGSFSAGTFTNAAGSRAYKLYIPSGHSGEALPLIVMLHGCTQNPDDFAAGTRMNEIAERERCLVLYPAQSKSANPSNCWNWFQPADQRRDAGEPAILAGMTREIIARHGVDPGQVYVAGLSAGGAMALIMGTVYPDLFTAVGVHSGLPYASAKDLPSALAAMQGSYRAGTARSNEKALPIIVFHGDQDKTVSPDNAQQIIAQWTASQPPGTTSRRESGQAERSWVTESTSDSAGKVIAESWTVAGAGHAWSGGSSQGSYTDPRGPDASAAMVRFFFTHPHGVQAAAAESSGK